MEYINVTSDLKEIKQHGNYSFPYMVYPGNIPEYTHSYPLHWHEEMEIIYVSYGTGIANVNSIRYTLSKGDILVILPHEVHAFSQFENRVFEFHNILFGLPLLEDRLSDQCYERHLKPLLDHTKKLPVLISPKETLHTLIQPFIKELIEQFDRPLPEHELIIRSHLLAIIYHLEHYAIDSSDYVDIETDLKIKTALTYIAKNYSNPITIEEIAQSLNYSKSHFMKFFKKQTGSSFIQYLNNYRLEIAASMLVETNDRIIDIANRVGFDNLSYFTRSFQKKYNATPSSLRSGTVISDFLSL